MTEVHPRMLEKLVNYDESLVELYFDVRKFVLEVHNEAFELIYDTHSLTTVFSPTKKLGDAYCHIPIYSEHLNLGFNQGAHLKDPNNLLKGTGKSIRHFPIRTATDLKTPGLKELVEVAFANSISDLDKGELEKGEALIKFK